jgi:hypothetical protein
MSARFDWYQATVQAELSPLRGALLRACEGGAGQWEDVDRAPQGYGAAAKLLDGSGEVARIWFGGMHSLPHVVSSGETAQRVSEVLRAEFSGQHRVTRADACIDYAEPGAYDRLQAVALGVAKDCRIKVGTAGDHLLTFEGRTLYLGAPSSHTRLRLYDKAAELRQKLAGDMRVLSVPAELARLECQVRPKTREARAAAAQVSPVELMGSAAWMRELMRRAFALELEPFEAGRPWRQADDDRAYAALLGQYGGLLRRVCDDLGSWDMLGRQIGDDLARLEAEGVRRRYGR